MARRTPHLPSFFLLLLAAFATASDSSARQGTQVGFVETFALAEDRGAVLDQLVTGTEEHFYYSCLHLQQQGDLAAADGLLEQWRKIGRSGAFRQIETRQALLRASTDVEATYTFLEEELGLTFDHRRAQRGVVPDLPTAFDNAEIERDRLVREILSDHRRESVRSFRGPVLESLVRMDLTKEQRAELLDRLERPDVPGLAQAVLADLNAYPDATFGSRRIHAKLLVDQLEALRARRPALLSNRAYVDAVLRRLAPAPDESISDLDDRVAYLDRALEFAALLPDTFNSLKAHLLNHRLVLDLDLRRPDRARFMRYLRLPRNVSYLQLSANQRSAAAQLDAGFGGITPLPAVHDDLGLVTEMLGELLRGADSYNGYLQVLPERFVQRVWAETKLLQTDGGDVDELIRMLGGAEAAQRLKDRVEVEFVRTNPTHFGADDVVALAVDIKNVESLIVKVFEIDAVSYFDSHLAGVPSSIDLDGLVANDEDTLTFDEPPLRRVRHLLQLPQARGAGTYVVELIGGGVSSRAVVRKGELHLLERIGSAGQVFHVLDGDRAPVPSAAMRFGGRDFVPDEHGEILIPFTTQPGRKTVLLRADGVTSVTTFNHLGETYALDVVMHVAEEALLAGETATVAVRPRLSLNGKRVPLELLEGASLVITATDREGTASTRVVDGLVLKGAQEFAEEIKVPENLASLSVHLTAKVRSLSAGVDIAVASQVRTIAVNGASRTADVAQALLTRIPGGYAIDLRGRNGEPLVDREVLVRVRSRFIDKTVEQRLKSDAQGRVALGGLRSASSVQVSGPAGGSGRWDLAPRGTLGLPGDLRALAGATLRVPFEGQALPVTREMVSLIQVLGDLPGRDRFDRVEREDGYLALRGLEPGEYRLALKGTGETYRVQVVAGVARFGHVVSERRALAASSLVPLTIRTIKTSDDGLRVNLVGVTEATRVHVFTSRYVGRFDARDRLFLQRRERPLGRLLQPSFASYESGREISDEYRYILERRGLDTYPGNMLARAGVLLNPWVIGETTDRMSGAGGAGGAYDEDLVSNLVEPMSADARNGKKSRRAKTQPVLDFLAEPSVALIGLVPDENGSVTIKLDDLGGNHMIRIVAVDDDIAVARDLTRSEEPPKLRDRRLIDGLDPALAMTQQRRISFLRAGDTLDILDAPNANASTFDTLADVFGLYRTMNSSSEFAKFEFVTRWPTLSDAEKRETFSEFVCHELNVFLHEKDPEFFAAVVAPYIANKGHRTFLDDWLLERDLEGYLEPWRFERLNIVEKILLLRRVDGQASRVAEDMYALVPFGTFSLEPAFQVVLASGGLSAERPALAGALESARTDAVRFRAFSGGGVGGDGPTSPGAPVPSRSAPSSKAGGIFLGTELIELEKLDLAAAVLPGSEDLKRAAQDEVQQSRDAFAEAERGLLLRQSVRSFYRDLAATQELAETHYWRIPLSRADQNLITVSPFWVDFAAAGDAFVSTSFPLATRGHTEMLLALAFLDLPFEAVEHEIESEGRGVRMTARSPLLLALEDIAPAQDADGGGSVLVGQDIFRNDQRTEVVNGIQRERFVSGELLVGVPYGCRMVLTNPSSAAIELQALVQIPEGAIALSGTRVTRGHPLTIPAYGTQALETVFYFPTAGVFRDYPIHAGQDGVLLGAADARELTVVETLSEVDTGTWEWISQNADLPGVLAYLEAENPRSLDLSSIAWRMSSRASFDAVTAVLTLRSVYAPVLWQYGIKHRDAAASGQYLATQATLIQRVEAPFASPLFSLDAQDRGSYEHLAYEPLINGRAHEFGGERRILNDQFARQYQRFLRAMALQRDMGPDDRMELAYYMLLQDRIADAIAAFDSIERDSVVTLIQYDYMAAYMDFYRGDTEHARAVASSYTDHPVDRWRARFRNVIAQLDEIDGGRPVEGFDRDDRDEAHGALAGTEPILELDVEAGRVMLAYERLTEVEVRYHLMDIEFLFSTNPFVRGEGGAFGFIEPNKAVRVSLPADTVTWTFDIPDEYRRANLFVEVRGAGLARRATYFAGSLSVQGLERYGQLRVVESTSSRPLPRAYVKVYARLSDGRVRFHKDGYTDLRGRFDYVSVSGWDGAQVERYAVLVMHEEAGATITELAPPVR